MSTLHSKASMPPLAVTLVDGILERDAEQAQHGHSNRQRHTAALWRAATAAAERGGAGFSSDREAQRRMSCGLGSALPNARPQKRNALPGYRKGVRQTMRCYPSDLHDDLFVVQMTAQSERLSSRCKVEDNISEGRWYVPPNALVNASRGRWKPATKPVLRVGNTIESVAIPGAALGRAQFRDWFWVSTVTATKADCFTESS